MITIDRKNKMAVDIALHIPLPSFRIRIAKEEDAIAENTPLSYNKTAEDQQEAALRKQQAADPSVDVRKLEEDVSASPKAADRSKT